MDVQVPAGLPDRNTSVKKKSYHKYTQLVLSAGNVRYALCITYISKRSQVPAAGMLYPQQKKKYRMIPYTVVTRTYPRRLPKIRWFNAQLLTERDTVRHLFTKAFGFDSLPVIRCLRKYAGGCCRGEITLTESHAKCRYLKNWPVKGLCASCLSVRGPLPSKVFVWDSNFVGSKSCQKQSVKLLQNMVSNTTHQHPTPSQPNTVCRYCTFTLERGGGVGKVNQREG